MSEKELIQPIKDVQFTYSSFLWKDLAGIRELQKNGEYYSALWDLLDLIDWLPEDFQDKMEFQKKAKQIRQQLENIKTNRILPIQQDNDLEIQKNRISCIILKKIIPELSKSLDRKGYMERKGGVQTISRSMKDFQMEVDQARYGRPE